MINVSILQRNFSSVEGFLGTLEGNSLVLIFTFQYYKKISFLCIYLPMFQEKGKAFDI